MEPTPICNSPVGFLLWLNPTSTSHCHPSLLDVLHIVNLNIYIYASVSWFLHASQHRIKLPRLVAPSFHGFRNGDVVCFVSSASDPSPTSSQASHSQLTTRRQTPTLLEDANLHGSPGDTDHLSCWDQCDPLAGGSEATEDLPRSLGQVCDTPSSDTHREILRQAFGFSSCLPWSQFYQAVIKLVEIAARKLP